MYNFNQETLQQSVYKLSCSTGPLMDWLKPLHVKKYRNWSVNFKNTFTLRVWESLNLKVSDLLPWD